jgi:hypothetical protein
VNIWTEFKNAILPWILAGTVEQQGKALDGVRGLLASQGYTLPPLTKPQ